MKKLLTILFILLLLCSCNNKKIEEKKEFRFTDYYEYMIDNEENINSIKMITITEGGESCYNVTSFKDKIYNNVINTTIISKASTLITDDYLIYQFVFNDGEIVEYKYNGPYLVLNGNNYEIDNYLILSITDIEDLRIDCN